MTREVPEPDEFSPVPVRVNGWVLAPRETTTAPAECAKSPLVIRICSSFIKTCDFKQGAGRTLRLNIIICNICYIWSSATMGSPLSILDYRQPLEFRLGDVIVRSYAVGG